MIIETKLTEEIVNLVFSSIKNKLNSCKEKYEWKKLFVDTGEFLTNDKDHSEKFYDDLMCIFSEENMKKIANDLRGKTAFKLRSNLHKELSKLMLSYEFSLEMTELYSSHFIQVIISYLEENMPEKYTQIFLADWKKEEENNFRNIYERLSLMNTAILALGEKKQNIFSMSEIDAQLRKETISPKIGIDFFEIDDEEFLSDFHKKLELERIFIVGKSREETIYCVLNELQKMNLSKIVLVVKNEDEWLQLGNKDLKDAILIPWFFVGSINAISENTNIFVYGEDEPCYVKDFLKLKKRTKRTIANKLEEAGLDIQEAHKLVEDTNGLYVPLKIRIYNGGIYQEPTWAKNRNSALVAALLCGKWTECEGDKLVLEELAGMKYDDIMRFLSNYMKGANPFIVKVSDHGGAHYQLASVEMAWENLDYDITDKLWKQFVDLLYEVLIESEPIFEYPFEKHFEASLYAKKPDWSPILKKGMIRSLIMRAIYRKDAMCQYQINSVISNVLVTINSKERWGYIAQYFTDLCEAAPEIVLKRLEDELVNETGMKELFGINDGDFIMGRHYYTNILWAVEQLLLQREYAVRAVRWLWKADSLNIKYSISNSPRSILETVFCAWINVSVLKLEEKIESVKWAISNFENAWDIIYSELPEKRNTICSTINHPHYRNVDEIEELYVSDINKIYIEYIHACLSKMDVSAEKWKKIIESMENYYDELIDEIIVKLLYDIELMNDEEKILIKDTFRHEIYRHRYFASSEWSMPESRIVKFESIMNQIHTADPVYEYLYLFESTYDFPLIHPIPFDKEENSHEYRNQNKLLQEMEIENGIKEFVEKKLSLKQLLILCSNKEQSTIGLCIAKYYGDKTFDESIMSLMVNYNVKDSAIADYVWYFQKQNEPILERAIQIAMLKENNENLVVSLLSMELLSDEKEPLIANQVEEIKKIFWGRSNRFFVKNNKNSYKWALSECKKYGSISTFLEILFDSKEFLDIQEIFDEFKELDQVNKGIWNSMSSYYLEEILKLIQEAYKEDSDACAQISTIEWKCRNILQWDDMKCTQIVMKETPVIYAELARYIFLHEGEDKESRTDEMRKISSDLYDIYHKAQFCPAEKDGRVDSEKLKKWVEEFRNLLKQQGQINLFGHLIGRLFTFSPIGDDNCMPCEAVRQIIEEIYDDSLQNAYITAEVNKRGVYTPDAGKTELEMSKQYKENANKIRGRYTRTAIIYDLLSDRYKAESIAERKRAEDDW